ncbi:MAG: ABC transporter permease [Anaerolineae bacterium]|jgi:ABC-type lipoprotein release transport system permease subunit|nr:ABC transporter permease [Anaerolineae bacterium]MDH7474806.1 ABC transporter permease [Anaerolineae bacterium]
MVFKNLFRRKGRTILTLLGISIGVAAIVALGAVGQGLRAGFGALTRGSRADLVLTQANAYSALMSAVDESVADEISTWGEIAGAEGFLFTIVVLDGSAYLYVFGYEPDGFAIQHFRIVEGQGLAEARGVRGKPLILGRRAAESLKLQVGDSLRLTSGAFRVVGIFETGDGLEDRAAVVPLAEAQTLAHQPHLASMIYVKLRDPSLLERVRARIERRFPDLTVSTTAGFADREQMVQIVEGMAAAIAALAVVIGGVGMTNTLFMSVFERTREIGLLRALGWHRRQVLTLILSESLVLALIGGAAGVGLGVLVTWAISRSGSYLGLFGTHFSPALFARALITVVVLGLVGGAYPAWWASRLQPVEALQYEGGAGGRGVRRRVTKHATRITSHTLHLPATLRNLWRRRTRTALTLLGIGIGISAIIALGGYVQGMDNLMTQMWRAGQIDVFAIEAEVDSDFSAIDERVGARIAARPDVKAVSGIIMSGISTPENPMLLIFGYHPRELAIRHFRIQEGKPLEGSREAIVGRKLADEMGLHVGDTLRLMNSNFRVVGVFETGLAYEDIAVVISLREAQALLGKPHQVMIYGITLHDPRQAERVRDELEAIFPEVDFALSSDATETMSDYAVLQEMVGQISFLAIFIGTVGMLNTMLMSVLERTREIGVLRALGWCRRRVLGMILRESLVLGGAGGVCGILLGLVIGKMVELLPGVWGTLKPLYTPQLLVQAVIIGMLAGVVGGLYPAWRATRMRPVEALRYE